MLGNGKHNKTNKNYPPPSVDELMKALVAKDDEKAVTVFSRALFLVDVPNFEVTYEGSKEEGRPIHFGLAGAMAGYCYTHMHEDRIMWKVYANVMDEAKEPREDFIGYLADTLKLSKFKKYYSDFLLSINESEWNEYYEAMEGEKMNDRQDSNSKKAETQEVAKRLMSYNKFSNLIAPDKMTGDGASKGYADHVTLLSFSFKTSAPVEPI